MSQESRLPSYCCLQTDRHKKSFTTVPYPSRFSPYPPDDLPLYHLLCSSSEVFESKYLMMSSDASRNEVILELWIQYVLVYRVPFHFYIGWLVNRPDTLRLIKFPLMTNWSQRPTPPSFSRDRTTDRVDCVVSRIVVVDRGALRTPVKTSVVSVTSEY